jgi:hypothetical protein
MRQRDQGRFHDSRKADEILAECTPVECPLPEPACILTLQNDVLFSTELC